MLALWTKIELKITFPFLPTLSRLKSHTHTFKLQNTKFYCTTPQMSQSQRDSGMTLSIVSSRIRSSVKNYQTDLADTVKIYLDRELDVVYNYK